MRTAIQWLLGIGAGVLGMPASPAWAQQQFDSSHGNYAGLSGVSWNPATVAGSYYALQIRLVGLDGHLTNSGYRYVGPWSLGQPVSSFSLSGRNVEALAAGRPQLFSAGVELRGPGVLVRLGSTAGLALGTRVRTLFQGADLSPSLVQSAVDGFRTPSNWRGSAFNLNLNTVTEWTATYGQVLVSRGRHHWKAGITGKYLLGLGAAYAQGSDISYRVAPNPYYANEAGVVAISQLQGAYGAAHYASPPQLNFQTARRYLLGQDAVGSGWGADLGFIYEYRLADIPTETPTKSKRGKQRPARLRPNYRFRLGASLTDLGSVTYATNTVAYTNLSVRENLVQQDTYDGINIRNYESRLPGIYQTDGRVPAGNYVAGMPTALHLDIDYRLTRSLYVNASVCQGLRGATAIGMHAFSYACVAPRLETPRFGLAFPLALANNYQQPAVGCQLRLGFLAVGSANILPLLGAHSHGASAYAEVSLLNLVARHHNLR